jgi:hypothetical protein
MPLRKSQVEDITKQFFDGEQTPRTIAANENADKRLAASENKNIVEQKRFAQTHQSKVLAMEQTIEQGGRTFDINTGNEVSLVQNTNGSWTLKSVPDKKESAAQVAELKTLSTAVQDARDKEIEAEKMVTMATKATDVEKSKAAKSEATKSLKLANRRYEDKKAEIAVSLERNILSWENTEPVNDKNKPFNSRREAEEAGVGKRPFWIRIDGVVRKAVLN